MLWLRGAIFTILIPCVVGGYVPYLLHGAAPAGGWWHTGWVLVAFGAGIYLLCLLQFLAAGGTPTIYFTRPLRFLLGEEPSSLVEKGLYSRTRNPMYLGVVMVVEGQAIVYRSPVVALYGAALWAIFHFVVTMLEEPHLRVKQGAAFERYCRSVPRWFGKPV